MNLKKSYVITFLLLLGFVFTIGGVNAVSGKMTSSYDRCNSYYITSTYRTYAVINSLKNYTATKSGSPLNAEYITTGGSKKIVYCIQKGPNLPLGKTITYTAFSNTDDSLTSSSVSAYNKGALARAVAYGRNGTHSACTETTYDRVGTSIMAHMLNKCVVNNTDSVCTSTSKRWDYVSDSTFKSRIKSMINSTSSRETNVANYTADLRTKVLQQSLTPSFSYKTLDEAKKNARYLASINTTNKNNPVFSLSAADSTVARNKVSTLASGLWKVSSKDTGLTAAISSNKLNVSTTKDYLGKTMCVTLTKTEKAGTLYRNTTGQDTIYMLTPTTKTITVYACFKTNYMKVNKVSTNNNTPLDGAKFNIFETEADCNANNNPVSNVSGIPFANQNSGDKYSLAVGNTYFYNVKENATKTYYVGEVTPPLGYILPSDSKKCQIAKLDDSTGVTFKNIRVVTTNVQVIKKDKYSDDPIKGVKLGLYDDNKCTVPTTILATSDDRYQKDTDVSGQVLWSIDYTGQTEKKLYVKEENLPSGYVKMPGVDNCYEVEIAKTVESDTSNEVLNSITIYNMPYGDIRIIKKDIDSGKVIQGIKFRLLNENKKPATDKDGNTVATSVTDKNGIVLFNNINYGTYYIEEVKVASKYKYLDEPVKMILNKNTDSIFLTKNGTITFKHGDIVADGKIDSYDLDALNLMLSSKDGTLGIDKSAFAAADVNDDGKIDSKDKEIFDAYLLYKSGSNSDSSNKEIISDAGSYAKRKENVCMLITNSAECDTDALSLDRINAISVARSSVENSSSAVDMSNYVYDEVVGSWFDKAGNPVDNPNASFCTDTSGLKFKLGDVNGDCLVNATDANALQELITTGTQDQLVIVAGDINGDGKLTNDDVTILNNYINYSTNQDFLKSIKTLINTEKTLGPSVDEVTAEYLSKIGTTGVISRDEAQASILITNEKIDVKISKQNATGSKEIPGAKMVLKNSNGKIVKSFISKKSPTEFYIASGKYTLTETIAPSGYKKLDTVISFRVGTDGNIKLLSSKSNNYKIVKSTGEDTDLDHIIIYNRLSKEVIVPDTASNIKFIFIALGLVLIGGAGYVVYKKYN